MASCRECGAAVEWVRLMAGSGAHPGPHPIDVGVVLPAMVGAVALNRATGGAMVVRGEDVDRGRVVRWADQGVEFRRSHFASCPRAQAVREAGPGQEALF